MKVLVACEESQEVCKAFRALEDLTGQTFRELFGECEGRR